MFSAFQDTPSRSATKAEVVPALLFSDEEPETQLQPSFDLLNLKLMHHYASVTYCHLIAGEEQSKVWQQHVAMLASSNAVLMHQILTISALPHAENDANQGQAFIAFALHHHGVSILGLQSSVADASSANAELIVMSSILLAIWAYAFFRLTYEITCLDLILDIIGILRRSRSVFQLDREVVMKTPIAGHCDSARCSRVSRT